MTPILSIQNVVKNFDGLAVIRDVTFSVEAGERVALIGPNGAGKTTLFNLITGVYPVTSGSIHVGGQDVTHLADWKRTRHGVIRSFQNIRLMPHLTALENVMLGQHSRASGFFDQLSPVGLFASNRWRKEAQAVLDEAGLSDYAQELVYNLPYGVQKRIELARAMSARPKLLLLDEPAAGLNSEETEQLTDLLLQLSDSGITLVVVEHDMHFVRRLCQHVVVLNFGEKIAEGTPSDIQKNPLVLEAYLGSDRGLEAGHVS